MLLCWLPGRTRTLFRETRFVCTQTLSRGWFIVLAMPTGGQAFHRARLVGKNETRRRKLVGKIHFGTRITVGRKLIISSFFTTCLYYVILGFKLDLVSLSVGFQNAANSNSMNVDDRDLRHDTRGRSVADCWAAWLDFESWAAIAVGRFLRKTCGKLAETIAMVHKKILLDSIDKRTLVTSKTSNRQLETDRIKTGKVWSYWTKRRAGVRERGSEKRMVTARTDRKNWFEFGAA